MPKSTTCKFQGRIIIVQEALKLAKADRQGLTCIKCGELVSPHRGSAPRKKKQAAHFEHPASAGGRNADCPLSDHRHLIDFTN
jgi:hypothetical protein